MSKLKDITLNIVDGVHGDCQGEDDSGYYFISVKDMLEYSINYTNARQITHDDYIVAHKRTALEEYDVLFANSGHTIGKMLQANKSSVKLGQTTFQKSVALLKPDKNLIDPYYFYYLIKFNVNGLRRAAVGSAQKNLLLDDMRNFNVDIKHQFEEQSNAILPLYLLDRKIKLNNRVIIELEEMAKTIYDYWFVQFDFPNAEGKPYRSSGGEMVWNGQLKREIPKGWSDTTLFAFIKEEKGGDWGNEKITGNFTEQVICIRGADFPGLIGKQILNAPTRYILKKNTGKALSDGDIIVEISGGSPAQSTGRVCYINKEVLSRFDVPVITSNFCKSFSLTNQNWQYWFYTLWEKLYNAGLFFRYEGKTTGIKNLLFDMLCSDYHTIYPDITIAWKYNDLVKPLFEDIQKRNLENFELTKLRDWLLPMLMNGQVTLK